MMHHKERKKLIDDLMPETVWLPTILGLLLIGFWKFDSSVFSAFIVLITVIFCRFVLERIFRVVFGEMCHNFSFYVIIFVTQCVIWFLII
jgi:hypothetical protein